MAAFAAPHKGIQDKQLVNQDMNILKQWVTAGDSQQWDGKAKGTVVLHVSHSNLKMKMIELKFDLHDTIMDVKSRIYKHTGSSPASMQLTLTAPGEAPVGPLDNSKMLGFYSPQHGWDLHAKDTDVHSISARGALENTDLIKKYRMTEEDYDAKETGTIRSWKKAQLALEPLKRDLKFVKGFAKLNAKDGVWVVANEMGCERVELMPEKEPAPGEESVAHVAGCVGQRCEVHPGARRGELAFVGAIDGMSDGGYWCGVKFDEPVGRSAGDHGGVTYFEAGPGFGGFVRGKNIQCGDFPERDLLDEDDDEDEDEL